MNGADGSFELVSTDQALEQVVPSSGFTVWLTVTAGLAMSFLAVFALALSLATGRLADRWADSLASASTVRLLAPPGQEEAQLNRALEILRETPGIASARALSFDEDRALLAPWFGPDLPLESLPVPRLIDVVETGEGYDREGLRQRFAAEVPAAVLDDHTRWRAPLVDAARSLRWLGVISLTLILVTTGVMVTLAAQAALAANENVIRVLRLVGATDLYIARSFIRRFTKRAFAGACAGTLLGMLAIALLPPADDAGGFLTGLGFQGFGWIWPLFLPLIAGAVAYAATRAAAIRMLRKTS